MVGLGVSIGDVVALCTLAKNVVISLKDSTGSSNEYLRTIAGLRYLELVLLHVQKCLDILTEESQKAALRHLVSECKTIIDDFLGSLGKYHGHLSVTGTKRGFKDAFRKIEWHICMTEDLKAFREKVDQHLQSLQILLVTHQLSDPWLKAQFSNIEQTLQDQGHTLDLIQQSAGMIRHSFDTLINIAYQICQLCQQTSQSMVVMKQILSAQNDQIERFCAMQSNLPPQVLFSQPVILIDAFNEALPFHLETVSSKDVLMAILRERYREAGLQKLTAGDFVIEDTRVNQDIDLARPWHLCFRAGDQKAMSFVFSEDTLSQTESCPWCKYDSVGNGEQWVKCRNCDRSFRRIEQTTLRGKPALHQNLTSINEDDECSKRSPVEGSKEQETVSKHLAREDTLQDFHRVRLERRLRLLCPLSILLNCNDALPTVDELIRHALSHFGPLVPAMPLPVRCFHCPVQFGRQLLHNTGPAGAWKDMLKHIVNEHYQNGKRNMPNIFTPDPLLIRWMYARTLVTEDQMKAIGFGHDVLDKSNARIRIKLPTPSPREAKSETMLLDVIKAKYTPLLEAVKPNYTGADTPSPLILEDTDDALVGIQGSGGHYRMVPKRGTKRTRHSQCDAVLIAQLSPCRPDIAAHVGNWALHSESSSEDEGNESEEDKAELLLS